MKTWHKIFENKIIRIRETSDDTKPKGDGWIAIPHDWGGSLGDDVSWYDKTMHRIPDVKLMAQGKRIDNIGRWYNKNDFHETKQIHCLDEEAGDGWTQEIPLENELYQTWDDSNKTWIIDTVKKEAAEKESKKSQIEAEIAEIEQKRLRLYLRDLDGLATQEDKEWMQTYKNKITDLKNHLTELETA